MHPPPPPLQTTDSLHTSSAAANKCEAGSVILIAGKLPGNDRNLKKSSLDLEYIPTKSKKKGARSAS